MDVSAAHQRLALLERRVRRLQLALAALLVLGAAAFLMGSSTLPRVFEEIHAQRFILQNEVGQVRGIWETADDVASLTMYDVSLRPRLKLQVTGSDSSDVQLLDKNKNIQLAVHAREEHASVVLFDAERKARLMAGCDSGTPHVSLLDSSEAVRIRLEAAEKEAKFLLYDTAGRDRFQMYTINDIAGLGVKDDAGRQRIIISEIPGDGPIFLMRDGDRRTIFHAP